MTAIYRRHFNTLRPRQNGRHFPDDIFICIFLNENAWILFTISPNFVAKSPINNIPSSVQIMAWCRSGDKPFSGPMMALFTDAYMRHSASMSQNAFLELKYLNFGQNVTEVPKGLHEPEMVFFYWGTYVSLCFTYFIIIFRISLHFLWQDINSKLHGISEMTCHITVTFSLLFFYY